MRLTLLLIILLMWPLMAFSQTSDTIYLNGFRERCNIASADYYRVSVKLTDNYYSITDRTIKGDKVVMIGYQNKHLSTDPMHYVGQFTYYDSRGKKVSEGRYINGTMEGTWILYEPSGTILTRVNMVNGEMNGAAEIFDFGNGKIIAEGRFYIGNKAGEWKYYEPYTGAIWGIEKYDSYGWEGDKTIYDTKSGKIELTCHYSLGRPNGTMKVYYKGSDRIRYTMEYNKGILEGKYYHLDSSTQLYTERGEYLNNIRVGTWRKYYTDTLKVMSVANYLFGDLDSDLIFFDTTGRIKEITKYKFGKKEGNSKIYYPGTSQIWINANYSRDSLEGQLNVLYQDGKLKRSEVYKAGKMISGKCYEINGKEIPCMPLQTLPQFSGDITGYFSDSLLYPTYARVKKIQGKVVVRFLVDDKGKVREPEIIQSLNIDCDNEAMRLISEMPVWKPGQLDGVPYPMYQTIPVEFKLQ